MAVKPVLFSSFSWNPPEFVVETMVDVVDADVEVAVSASLGARELSTLVRLPGLLPGIWRCECCSKSELNT